jgi:hypothetical protein
VGEEHNVDDGAERLSASAFLARYEGFRYIETRSETKMSDNETIVRESRGIIGENPSAPQCNSMNRASRLIFSYQIRHPEPAILKIKSPNSVSRTCSNPLKTNDRDTLKSPKNQESGFLRPPDSLDLDSGLRQGTAFYPELRRTAVPESTHDSGVSTPEVREIKCRAIFETDCSRYSTLLTGSGPQTEIDVTCSKQTTEKFLTGARTHIRETRICAKMSAQISSKLSAQMSEIR